MQPAECATREVVRDETQLPATAWRVAAVQSSANPGHCVPWLAVGDDDIARVGKHRDFVSWLSGYHKNPMRRNPFAGMQPGDAIFAICMLETAIDMLRLK